MIIFSTFRTLGAILLVAGSSAQAAVLSFEDLPSPPLLTSGSALADANNGSAVYGAVTWDSRFEVVGDAYRVDPVTPGPFFGRPQSGHYFLSNGGGSGLEASNGLLITTPLVLISAWFGGNEYYGFGAGADQVTIVALAGNTELGAVVVALPDAQPGLPEALSFVDTSVFASLAGITAYRIDRRKRGDYADSWVADDFSFVPANGVPEPATGWLMIGGLALWAGSRSRRRC